MLSRPPYASAAVSKPSKIITFDPCPPLATVLSVDRKMSAGGSSYLAHAGGSDYVLKVPSEDRPLSLFHEALGELLGSELGLPMAGWSALSLGSVTVDYTGTLSHMIPGSGYLLCFGSRICRQMNRGYEYLPESWIKGTEVASQLARVQVFDAWVNNAARRQYVAHRSQAGELQIQFIANGAILGPSDKPRPNPYDFALRLGVDPEQVSGMFDQISCVLRITLERLTRIIPDCWMRRSDVDRSLAILEARQRDLLKPRKDWLRTGVTGQGLLASLRNHASATGSTARPWISFSEGF